jgi:hypothetical protein
VAPGRCPPCIPQIPSVGSLLQPVQRSVETADIVRMCGVLKTRRLCAENCLLECAIKKCILDVELVDGHCRESSRDRTVHTVAGLTTGLKVSSKLTLGRWVHEEPSAPCTAQEYYRTCTCA